ncbi:uncharacterized protein BCR38DRAFT_437990 [Pseudomassariella vexata]|uniref:Uncharacterized protein n=1 Tax=Pseudomassariella vexata TaxID=1141098 RepID=A0A1Y2DSM8_9PEZI|nr:uncharacterized protein BCR38DRAFT_437990 [Pseudomassariella vexata]ORY62272.1 hypothetical protein BCR38DRAFT_437990 [Pseudomassariella vexata]
MFELFLHWLYERNDFQQHIDEAEANNCCEDLHDDLINLHLFAAQIELAPLQDIAMDAIQDIYLRCNWDIRPRLVSYIYTECSPIHSCRIRKWIVAMTAWSLGGDLEQSATGGKMEVLFQKFPDFWADYVSHLSKTSKNRIKLHFKNPQLRLPTNNLRNEERHFGFRQCSFHTHRSSVGQGKCPHTLAQQQYRAESPVSSEYSDSSSPGLIFPEDMVSPRTAIFDLYLATP